MSAKLDKIGKEWEKAATKRDLWTARADELEARYKEQENLEICEVTHSFNLTPDQLAELLSTLNGKLPGNESEAPAEEYEENDDEEGSLNENEEADQ